MTDGTKAPRKETPTQRVERIKREKAPWSIMDDIRRYAKDGFAAIPADDLAVRFRAWGLYTQGDGHGELLELSAEVQDHHHRLRALVHLPRDQPALANGVVT